MKKYFSVIVLSFVIVWTTSCKKTEVEQITKTVVDSTGNKSPEYVITDYGAVADGKTDCGAVINKIINILPPSGGTIIIPEGDFLVNTTINLNKSFITISGLNPGERSGVDVPVNGVTPPGGGSKLILGSAAAIITVPVLPQVNGVTNRVSGLEISNLVVSGGTTSHGIGIDVLQDNDHVLINNVIGINLTTGIYANAADDMVISSCWISECTNSISMPNGVQNTISDCQLGAQPTGITVELDNQVNFNFTGNQVYPDGSVNLQINNSQYVNVSSNNFQSYYVGMIELNSSNDNLISSNIFAMELPSDTSKQLRGNPNTYGVLRLTGNNNLVSGNSITCAWANPNDNPVTIRSIGGTGNSYDNINITDTKSSSVFYVSGGCNIFNSVPASNVYIDGSAANINIQY